MTAEIWTYVGVIAIILGGAYIIFSNKLEKLKSVPKLDEKRKITYPLQIQAYERMILFLERIRPQNMFSRLNTESLNTSELQRLILKEIRTEFEHNTVQQLYISKEVWGKIEWAANSVSNRLVTYIGNHQHEVDSSKEILVNFLKTENDSANQLIQEALNAIKDEAQRNF